MKMKLITIEYVSNIFIVSCYDSRSLSLCVCVNTVEIKVNVTLRSSAMQTI